MKGVLTRTYEKKQTRGELKVYEQDGSVIFSCRTLELQDLNNAPQISCIPEGTYFVHPHVSPSKGKCFAVDKVPGRANILIHAANYVGSANPKTGHSDLLGCVGVGTGYSDLTGDGIVEIINSKNTLMEMLKAVPSGFNLLITHG